MSERTGHEDKTGRQKRARGKRVASRAPLRSSQRRFAFPRLMLVPGNSATACLGRRRCSSITVRTIYPGTRRARAAASGTYPDANGRAQP